MSSKKLFRRGEKPSAQNEGISFQGAIRHDDVRSNCGIEHSAEPSGYSAGTKQKSEKGFCFVY